MSLSSDDRNRNTVLQSCPGVGLGRVEEIGPMDSSAVLPNVRFSRQVPKMIWILFSDCESILRMNFS